MSDTGDTGDTGGMRHVARVVRRVALLPVLALAACAQWPAPDDSAPHGDKVIFGGTAPVASSVPERAREVVLTALSLLETGYRFGGKNPEAGLDCSGMVSHVFASAQAARLSGSAADIARAGSPVHLADLRAGDLVFFDTRNAPYSHVGIYIGDARFIHAPSSRGKVRIDRLDAGWYAARITEARRYID